MADLDSLRYLIEALRTPKAAPGSLVHNYNGTGETRAAPAESNMAPLEQHRDGYRMYRQEKENNGETPLSYQEWFSQEQ